MFAVSLSVISWSWRSTSSPHVWNRVELINREFSIAVNATSGRSRDNVCPIDLRFLVM